VHVTLLYVDGCPNRQLADERLRALADEFDLQIGSRQVEGPDDAERLGFRGSPTILIDGRDPFAAGDEPVGLSCRIYRTPEGVAGAPTLEQLRAALTHHGG
jgi:hypothetical protein